LKLTDYLAIYAACLSTFVFAWNITRSIPRYKIDIVFGTKGDNDNIEHGVYIGIKNPSPYTVHLAGVELLYRYKESSLIRKITHFLKYRRIPWAVDWVHTSLSNYKLKDGCPLALESGKSHLVFVPNEVLEQILNDSINRNIKACVQDQLWRNKYSQKFHYPKNGIVTK